MASANMGRAAMVWGLLALTTVSHLADAVDVNGLYRYDKWNNMITENLKPDQVFKQPPGHTVNSCVMLCQLNDAGCSAFIYDEKTGLCSTFVVDKNDRELDATKLPPGQTLFINYSIPISDLCPENQAQNMSVSASSVNISSLAFSVDGITTKRNIFSTRHEDPRPWWAVDLGREFTVLMIRFYINPDFPRRLHDMEIRVGNNPITNENDPKTNLLCHEYIGTPGMPAGVKKAFDFVENRCTRFGKKGRYVSMQIMKDLLPEILSKQPMRDYKNVVTFREFEVYGFPEPQPE